MADTLTLNVGEGKGLSIDTDGGSTGLSFNVNGSDGAGTAGGIFFINVIPGDIYVKIL